MSAAPSHVPSAALFVGRAQELRLLRHGWKQVRGGRAIHALLTGRAGLGKSAIVARFLADLVEEHDAGKESPLALVGHCSSARALPYQGLVQALEPLVDWLLERPEAERQELVPREIGIVARLFPSFARLPEARSFEDSVDPQLARGRAASALRTLLANVSRLRGLVLVLEDAHHADRDTSALLEDLCQAGSEPAVFTLLTINDDQLAEDAPVRTVLDGWRVREGTLALPLSPLEEEDARALAAVLLGDEGESAIDRVIGEGKGSPQLLWDLSRIARTGDLAREQGEVLHARLARLAAPARTLLEVVAAAGEPVQAGIAGDAAGLGHDETERAAAALRFDGLLVGQSDLRVDQDRVRAAVLEGTATERLTRHHTRLAELLEQTGRAPVESLARHWLQAGAPLRARQYAYRAGVAAADKLAFDRAAEFFRAALGIDVPDAGDELALRVALADALANAGRGADSAEQYRLASALCTGDQHLRLRVSEVDQLLRVGLIVEGREKARLVLDVMGERMPRTHLGSLMSLGVRRLLVSMRGLRWKERDPSLIPAAQRTKLDLLWSIAMGLSVSDHIVGADYNARYLLRALPMGDPARVCKGLASEAAFLAAQGAVTRARMVGDESLSVAEELGDRGLRAFATLAIGMCEYFSCHFSSSTQTLLDSEGQLRDLAGAQREAVICRQFLLFALMYRGQLSEVVRRIKAYRIEAERRGDLFSMGSLLGRTVIGFLGTDDEPGAEEALELCLRGWPARPYYAQHWYEFFGRAEVALYRGEGARAHALVHQNLPALRGSFLLRVPLVRAEMSHLRGRAAIQLVEAGKGGDDPLREAMACARVLSHIPLDLSLAFGRLLEAAVARLEGDPESAAALLGEAQVYFESTGALLWSAATARTLGGLIGGSEGAALCADAERRYQSYGVKSTDRITTLLVPGFRRAS